MESGVLITKENLSEVPDGALIWYLRKLNGASWSANREGDGEPNGEPRYAIYVKDAAAWLRARGLRVQGTHTDPYFIWATWMIQAERDNPDGAVEDHRISYMPLGTMFYRPQIKEYSLDQELDQEEDLL